MLRISYSQGEDGQVWALCGQLTGPWVQELRQCWDRLRGVAEKSSEIVDLSDVTFIDESGEGLLLEMRKAGVKFLAAGVATKHLLENLTAKGERPLRRSVVPKDYSINGGISDKSISK
jgi:anti-anti-sigma regulatory factor